MNNTYYIFFTNSEANGLLMKALEDGFQHCEILTNLGTYIAPLSKGLFIHSVEEGDIKKILENQINNDTIVVKYTTKQTNSIIKRRLIGVNTCVGIVKDVLGIRNIFIQTPYQLYKYLTKTGKILCQE